VRFLRRNAFLIYSIYAVTLVSGLLVTPIIVSALGRDEYGLWAFVGSLVVFFGLLDFGIAPSIIRFAAEQRGRGAQAEAEASELASAGLVLYGVVALATLALGLALIGLLPVFAEVPEGLLWPGRIALALLLAGSLIRFPFSLVNNLLAGQQRYDVINLGSLLSIVVYTVAVAGVLLVWDGGIVLVAALTLVATALRLGLPALWLRRELPTLRFAPALVRRARLRQLVGFSVHTFFINVASKAVFSADIVLVGIVLGLGASAHYGLAAKLFALVFGFGVSGATVLFPFLAELEGAEQLERQRRWLLSAVRVVLSIVLLATFPLVLLPERFLQAWLGSSYQSEGFAASVSVLVLLMLSLLFAAPTHVLTQILVARGRHARLALVRLATVGVNLVLSIVLALTVGIWGVALATLVTEGLAAALVLPGLVRREAGIGTGALLAAWFRPLAVALVAAVPTLLALGRLLPVDTLPEFGGVTVAWAILFTVLIWRFGLGEEERGLIRRTFLRLRPVPAVAQDEPA